MDEHSCVTCWDNVGIVIYPRDMAWVQDSCVMLVLVFSLMCLFHFFSEYCLSVDPGIVVVWLYF